MWIFFNGGFLTATVRPPKHTPSGDPRSLQVRARDAEHLRRFRRDFCPEMSRVVKTPDLDYQFRAYVTPEHLAAGTARIIESIDYENFKKSIDSAYGDEVLHKACTSIWGVLFTAYERNRPATKLVGRVQDWLGRRRYGSSSYLFDDEVVAAPSGQILRRNWWDEEEPDVAAGGYTVGQYDGLSVGQIRASLDAELFSEDYTSSSVAASPSGLDPTRREHAGFLSTQDDVEDYSV